MDIDKLFKGSKVPSSGSKRKMPDNPTPEMLKKMKMDVPPPPVPENGSLQPQKKPHAVTIQDEEDVDMPTDFAPGGDADYFVEEDDEGRFFGGGLTTEQKTILNIFDSAAEDGAQEDSEVMSITGIRRLLNQLDRAVKKNQHQRSKYPDDPSKFIDSEADLDSAIKALLPLAQAPVLAYPELVRSGTISLLINLLSHENVDIMIDVVDLVHELTDEDVGNEAEQEEDEGEKLEEALKMLIEVLVENSILDLLVDNLARLKETDESDRQGVFHILGTFENILGFNPELSTPLVSKTNILPWLLQRIESKAHDENRGYAAELLSIFFQNNRLNRLELGKTDGVETILKVLSQFRRKDPVDDDESEFMENVFDALCSALNEPEIKVLFSASEGVDLMVLMMKEKLQSRSRSIKTLDYAMSGTSGTPLCESFVDALGLKTLFSAFMGNKTSKKPKAGSTIPASEDTGHVLGIMSSLFSNLASDSPSRIRFLTKFVENEYEKVDRLLELRDTAQGRLSTVEASIDREKQVLVAEGEDPASNEDQWYLQRLDGGLFTLQNIDYILAWIAMEDDGARAHLMQMLDRKSKSVKDIVRTLQVYHDNVDEGEQVPSDKEGTEHAPSQKEILQGLILFLESC